MTAGSVAGRAAPLVRPDDPVACVQALSAETGATRRRTLVRALTVLAPGQIRAFAERYAEARRRFDLTTIERLEPLVAELVAVDLARGRVPVERPIETLVRTDDPAIQAAVARAWTRSLAPDGPPARPKHVARDRIRLGYLGSELNNSAAGSCMRDLFRLHDRSRFEVFVYALNGDDGTPYWGWFRDSADRFHDLSHAEFRARHDALHADGLDVLIDLTGLGDLAASRLVASRPAPVQLAMLGYPAANCGPGIDFTLADPVVVPERARGDFDERLMFMPHCFLPADADIPVDPAGSRRADHGLPEDAVVLAHFNSTRKLTRPFVGAVRRIMEAVPGSVFWVIADDDAAAGSLPASLAALGLLAARTVVAGRLKPVAHWGRIGLADLALDSFGYSGGATTIGTLVAGVPVLTLPGRAMAARMSASMLRAAGMPETVAGDVDGFVDLAVTLATDRARLRALRARLSATIRSSPLMDTAGWVRHLEAGLATAHAQAKAGAGFTDIRVGA